MKPKWLVEKDLFLDTEPRLIERLVKKGYTVKVVQYIPMDTDYSKFEKMFDKNDCVVYYGSLNLAMELKKRFKWIPGVYGDIEKYRCTNYYPHFGTNHINSDYICMTFGELPEKKDALFERMGLIFVRPDSILKEFTGVVTSLYNFEAAYKLMGFYSDVVKPDLPILISTVKDIQKEWRFIVVDGKVISGSLYRIKEFEDTLHEPCLDSNALDFAKQMAGLYNPERVWVLDICLCELGYKVLEIGCFSFAGMYGNDLDVIIDEVSRVAVEQYESCI